jgi:hypothetical protein
MKISIVNGFLTFTNNEERKKNEKFAFFERSQKS